ncbi:MAG TPA: hypothetical protein VFN42_05185 [Acetobacteraceae bacterium]|nr:hypothetical protein [Acetobacteraceae bacterium]
MLREQAARARRLARLIPGDPAEREMEVLAAQLDAEADKLELEPATRQPVVSRLRSGAA